MNPALLSSKRQDFQTPESELRFVRAVSPTRRIGLDPFTAPNNPTGALSFSCVENGQDGYRLRWAGYGLTFCNPEYGSNLGRFAKKVVQEANDGAEVITLTPSRTDTTWWQELAHHAAAGLFLKGRITFNDAATGQPCRTLEKKTGKWRVTPAPFPVFYGYFGPSPDAFRAAFAGRGRFL